ncbi:MAG: (2Fe-2S)-binding protein [Burkholderiaceae bacterium]
MNPARQIIRLVVNGERFEIEAEPRKLLADLLREDCRLTGTHVGCEHGVCGACTVWVDSVPARACLMFAAQVDGREVTTIESMAVDGRLSALQRALHEHHGLQCGFCTAGIVMTVEAYLRDHPAPTEEQIRDLLTGNLCRCTGYQNIVAAVRSAVAARAEAGDD